MSSIKRFNVEKRLSDMAVYNGVAYLAGQVPDDASLDITGQTQQVLATIDRLLAEAGTDKTKILMAQIYVANMKEFDGMNKAWDAGCRQAMRRRALPSRPAWPTLTTKSKS